MLLVIGGLLILSELLSYVSFWPSIYDFVPITAWSDEPYVKIIAVDGVDYHSYIPLVVGIIFVLVGVSTRKAKR